MTQLQQRAEELIPQVEVLLRNQRLDEYQVRAFKFLGDRLAEIRDEAKSGILEQVLDRKGEMARVVAESDPSILNPNLGGALMAVEAEYYGTR